MSSSLSTPPGGLFTAVVTPFREGLIDEHAFARLCEAQTGAGAGLVVGSEIGEGLSLGEAELLRLVQLARDVAGSAVPVFACLDLAAHRGVDELARLLIRSGATSLICRFPRSAAFGPEEAHGCVRRIGHIIDRDVLIEPQESEARPLFSEEMIEALFRAGLIAGLVLDKLDPGRLARRQVALGPDFLQLTLDDRLAACAQLMATWHNGDLGQFRTLRDVLSTSAEALNGVHLSVGLKAVLKQGGVLDGSVRAPLRCLRHEDQESLVHALRPLQAVDRMARRGRD